MPPSSSESQSANRQWFVSLPFAVLVVCIVWAAVYLPGLGTRELKGEEARRVLPGRTMLQTGDWIIPRSAGQIYNRKPPGINWATAAAIKVTGRMDEWTVRMPSALAMLALAVAVLVAMRDLLGREGSLLAALMVLTAIGNIDKGRLAEIEALYCSLFGIAFVSWLALWWREKKAAAWLVSGLALGLGFLVKGPPHVWYFYAIVIAVLAAEQQLAELKSWRHLAGLAIFFATWAWWAALNSGGNPQQDSGAVWTEQITHRLGFSEFDLGNWLLQIPASIASFLPWALLLPIVWGVGVRDSGFRVAGGDADEIDSRRKERVSLGLRRGLVVGFLVIAILPSSRPRFMLPLITVAAVLLALALMNQELRLRQRLRPWINGAIAIVCLGMVGYAALISRGVFTKHELRPFAAQIMSRTGPEPRIVLFRCQERMWPFYLGMGCREIDYQKELPPAPLWVMTPAMDRDENLATLRGHYKEPSSETLIREPLTDDAGGKGVEYVLMRFDE